MTQRNGIFDAILTVPMPRLLDRLSKSKPITVQQSRFSHFFYVCLILFFPSVGIADDKGILLVSDNAEGLLVRYLALELEALSYEVTVSDQKPKPEPYADFAKVANDADVVGVVRLFEERSVAEVWATNADTGTVIHRDVHIGKNEEKTHAQIAMEIAELLRASLLELNPPASRDTKESEHKGADEKEGDEDGGDREDIDNTEPSGDESEANGAESKSWEDDARQEGDSTDDQTDSSVDYRNDVRKSPLNLSVEILGGITFGPFEQAPSAQLWMGVDARLVGPFGLAIVGHGPLTGVTVEKSPAGTVSLKHGLIALEPRLTFHRYFKRVSPVAAVGFGFMLVKVKGDTASDGYSGKEAIFTTATIYGRVACSIRVTRRVRAIVGVSIGRSIPRVNALIGEEKILEWGRLVFSGLFGFEVDIIRKR